jgi:hypothetical protein
MISENKPFACRNNPRQVQNIVFINKPFSSLAEHNLVRN